MNSTLGEILKIFLPILIPGFSGLLYGIAILIDKDK